MLSRLLIELDIRLLFLIIDIITENAIIYPHTERVVFIAFFIALSKAEPKVIS